MAKAIEPTKVKVENWSLITSEKEKRDLDFSTEHDEWSPNAF